MKRDNISNKGWKLGGENKMTCHLWKNYMCPVHLKGQVYASSDTHTLHFTTSIDHGSS